MKAVRLHELGGPGVLKYEECPEPALEAGQVLNDFSLEVAPLNRELLAWESIYNTVRPHQALGYLTPWSFRQGWRSEHPPDKEIGTAGTEPDVPSPPYTTNFITAHT